MVIGGGPIGSFPIGGMPTTLLADALPVLLGSESPEEQEAQVKVATFLERRLLEQFHHDPERLRRMDRRQFEELVAELFDGFGYDVQLTCRTRDGGKDVVAVRRREVDTRILIQCKRPDPGNPVRIGAVRELLGVKTDDGASKAVLATTTSFTPDASIFMEKHRWELEGRDFDGIREWITQYMRLKGQT